jgi:hypothetical protein
VSEPKILEDQKLTVLIRDDSPFIHLGGSPACRSVSIELTNEQLEKIKLKYIGQAAGKNMYESIDKCFIENE